MSNTLFNGIAKNTTINTIDTAKSVFVRLNLNISNVNSVIMQTNDADLCINIATIVVAAYIIYFSLLKANMLKVNRVTAKHCLSSKNIRFVSNNIIAKSAKVRR